MTQSGQPEMGAAVAVLAEKVESLRVAVETMRASTHDELAAINTNLGGLAKEIQEYVPKIAVLEHRADQAERSLRDATEQLGKDIGEVRAVRLRDQEHQRWSTGLKVSAAIGALTILATLVIGIINLTQGG